MLALLLRNSASIDTYICPYVLAGPEREKGGAVARMLAHCDGDDGVDLAKAEALPGVFAVGSGTQGHAHVYAGLTRSVLPHQHEALCKGLGHYLGAKDPKFSDNDVLRPPRTWNFKPRADDNCAPPLAVTWLIRPTGVRIDPEELADLLGVELTDTPPKGVHKAREKSAPAGGGAWPCCRPTRSRSRTTPRCGVRWPWTAETVRRHHAGGACLPPIRAGPGQRSLGGAAARGPGREAGSAKR